MESSKFIQEATKLVPSVFDRLKFLNSAANSLPIDKNKDTFTRQVKGAFFSRVEPTPLETPEIVSLSEKCLSMLGFTKQEILDDHDNSASVLAGNSLPKGADPISHCYCGYQFGVFAGQLGDGRAIMWGDVEAASRKSLELQKCHDLNLQLKGAGLTPYSRHADGRAVMRSSIREYLCSEYLHALGIPTTRAASIVRSESKVVRDKLYDGRPEYESCAVVLRVAQTFMRFGSFEIFNHTDMRTGMTGPSHGLKEDMMP